MWFLVAAFSFMKDIICDAFLWEGEEDERLSMFTQVGAASADVTYGVQMPPWIYHTYP